jgi:hypothetical protein
MKQLDRKINNGSSRQRFGKGILFYFGILGNVRDLEIYGRYSAKVRTFSSCEVTTVDSSIRSKNPTAFPIGSLLDRFLRV